MQRTTPYPEWVFDGVERLPPRRAGKGPVDEDGKREYRVAACVHGCGGKVIVNAATFSENRRKSIEDHLSTCPCVADADRPTKKLRALSVCQVSDPAKCRSLAPSVHAKCERRISDLEHAQMETNARLNALEAKDELYDALIRRHVPSALPLPTDSETAHLRFKRALEIDVVSPLSLLVAE